MRGPQAAASPSLGAPAAPLPWQATHWAAYTCSPVFSEAGSELSLISTRPTGWMRWATASAASTSEPAPGFLSEVTNMTSRMIAMMGTTKDSTTAQMSCLGVLIGPSCGRSWSS